MSKPLISAESLQMKPRSSPQRSRSTQCPISPRYVNRAAHRLSGRCMTTLRGCSCLIVSSCATVTLFARQNAPTVAVTGSTDPTEIFCWGCMASGTWAQDPERDGANRPPTLVPFSAHSPPTRRRSGFMPRGTTPAHPTTNAAVIPARWPLPSIEPGRTRMGDTLPISFWAGSNEPSD